MERLKNVIQTIKDAVFPRFCIQCRQEGSLLCKRCFSNWQCDALCIDHAKKHITLFPYADPVFRELFCAWKYSFDQSAWSLIKKKIQCRPLAPLQHLIHMYGIEAIVYVPLHKVRYCKRGFDQAFEIALWLGDELDLPVVHHLKRVHFTFEQTKQKNDKERRVAMQKNPFSCIGEEISLSVLLVDDIWTTGATMHAATKALQQAGVKTIWKFTLAKG